MDGTTLILIGILLSAVLAAIYVNMNDGRVSSSVADEMQHLPKPEMSGTAPGLDLGEDDVLKDAGHPSQLLPLGWGMIVFGNLVALWAWFFMDITPVEYSDTVNIDAVSQRSMLHAAGLVTALAGVVLACAGHVVNEVRRGR